MKYVCTVLSVRDIRTSRRFYEELFGLKAYQDSGMTMEETAARMDVSLRDLETLLQG